MQSILEFSISIGYVIGVPLGGGLQEVRMRCDKIILECIFLTD